MQNAFYLQKTFGPSYTQPLQNFPPHFSSLEAPSVDWREDNAPLGSQSSAAAANHPAAMQRPRLQGSVDDRSDHMEDISMLLTECS